TGTHGSGIRNQTLAAAVRSLQLVTAEGDLITVDRGSRLFPAAAMSLGALGIVTQLTLDTVPAFEMRQYVYEDIPAEQALAHFDGIAAAAYSVSMFLTWRAPVIDQTWLKHKSGRDAPAAPVRWLGGRLADGPRHPVPGQPAVRCTPQQGQPGPWHERLPHFRPEYVPSSGAELQSEYLLPRAQASTALAALAGIGPQLAPVVQTAEIRTVAADELWLSPAYQRDCAAFHFTWIPDHAAVRPVLAQVEERLAALAARPHWGKLFGMGPVEVAAQFPRAEDFRRLMADYDPAGKFRNAFLARYLPA
ncbi:MAG: D-arabinono-1,4-lactone oxidase, partial [Streptosporangiaceae bacterium]